MAASQVQCGKLHLSLNEYMSGVSSPYELMTKENLNYLWWGYGGFPEKVGVCLTPSCSTCSSAWANSWSCDHANSASCWGNLGKTGPAQSQWAPRLAHPVACSITVLQKVRLILTFTDDTELQHLGHDHWGIYKLNFFFTCLLIKSEIPDRWFLV